MLQHHPSTFIAISLTLSHTLSLSNTRSLTHSLSHTLSLSHAVLMHPSYLILRHYSPSNEAGVLIASPVAAEAAQAAGTNLESRWWYLPSLAITLSYTVSFQMGKKFRISARAFLSACVSAYECVWVCVSACVGGSGLMRVRNTDKKL